MSCANNRGCEVSVPTIKWYHPAVVEEGRCVRHIRRASRIKARYLSSMPKLSIGIPVFNGQEFLPELLDSLLGQTFTDFEIVICDNASTDRTSQICWEYERRDSRVQYVRNLRNLGAVANFNRVFELSTAPLFKWAAHDDLHHEAYLETCVRLLEENPDVVLAHAGTAFIDDKGEILP